METYWVPREGIYDEADYAGKPRDVEVVLAADAQAAIAALQARLMTLKHHAGLDCGDNSCLYAENKTGMRTNGGCRCSPKRMKDDLERSRKACDNLQAQLTQRTAELEAANEKVQFLEKKNSNLLDSSNTVLKVKADQDVRLADLQAELERVRERVGQRGLEVVMIGKVGHYVSTAVKEELERVRGELATYKETKHDAI